MKIHNYITNNLLPVITDNSKLNLKPVEKKILCIALAIFVVLTAIFAFWMYRGNKFHQDPKIKNVEGRISIPQIDHLSSTIIKKNEPVEISFNTEIEKDSVTNRQEEPTIFPNGSSANKEKIVEEMPHKELLPSSPPPDPLPPPPTLASPHLVEQPKEAWNERYAISPLGKEAEADPIFSLIQSLNPNDFHTTYNDWLRASWFQKLPETARETSKEFLNNISLLEIDRQEEVFSEESDKLQAYTLFKKSIIYLYNYIQEHPEMSEHIVLQLNSAVGECPLTYHSSITTCLQVTLENKALHETPEEKHKKDFHRLYSTRRKEIVDVMATKFGRKETHTPNSIITLIGEKYKIPGYQLVIKDKQADLNELHLYDLINEFEWQNSPENLIDWFYRKVNGMIDSKFHLHTTIPDYLAEHFNADINHVRELVFDENFLIKIDAIVACLEAMKMITPKSVFNNQSKYQEFEIAFKKA